MGVLEVILICNAILLVLVLAHARAALGVLRQLHDDLHIVCTVLQESPAERSERETEGWEYAGTPNLIRQKKDGAVPMYREG
jgi:hypothetical protein